MYYLSQFHIGGYTQVITLNHRIEIHQREYSMVGMMGNELTLFSQARTIDTMRFKDNNRKISTHTDDHQWHKHAITTREFCYQENTRQRRVHHTRHHTSHAQQSEILFRYIDTYLVDIPKAGEQETCKTANKQGGCKRSTTAATTIRSWSSHNFGKQHQGDIGNQKCTLSWEKWVI